MKFFLLALHIMCSSATAWGSEYIFFQNEYNCDFTNSFYWNTPVEFPLELIPTNLTYISRYTVYANGQSWDTTAPNAFIANNSHFINPTVYTNFDSSVASILRTPNQDLFDFNKTNEVYNGLGISPTYSTTNIYKFSVPAGQELSVIVSESTSDSFFEEEWFIRFEEKTNWYNFTAFKAYEYHTSSGAANIGRNDYEFSTQRKAIVQGPVEIKQQVIIGPLYEPRSATLYGTSYTNINMRIVDNFTQGVDYYQYPLNVPLDSVNINYWTFIRPGYFKNNHIFKLSQSEQSIAQETLDLLQAIASQTNNTQTTPVTISGSFTRPGTSGSESWSPESVTLAENEKIEFLRISGNHSSYNSATITESNLLTSAEYSVSQNSDENLRTFYGPAVYIPKPTYNANKIDYVITQNSPNTETTTITNTVVNTITNTVGYTLSEVADMRLGSQMVNVSNNNAKLRFELDMSDDLTTSWQTNVHTIEVDMPVTNDVQFYRFRMD